MLFLLLLLIVTATATMESDYSEPEDPQWTNALNGGSQIRNGRTKRLIQLNPNQVTEQYQPCTLPNGKKGRCKPIYHCMREEFRNDFISFMDYMCVLPRNAVGACCPTNVDGVQALAGELPSIAPREEDNEAILKIGRAVNRGCGLSTHAQGRVSGSRPANPRDWPWMASVTPQGVEHHCGGVLITDRHVLTAAHCTRSWKASELTVRLGEYDLQRTDESRTYNFNVIEKIQHAMYEVSNYHHDIAILKLHRPAVFNSYVWPICLPPVGLDLTNKSSTITGWGTEFYGGPYSNVLMEVTVPIWEQQSCINAFGDSVFEENMCAGGHEGWKDACQYDSGGPLMYQLASGRWSVIGVVSWGIRCGEPNHPGIYTRVDKYLDWIMTNARF